MTQWAHASQDGFEGKLRIVSEVTSETENRHLQIANILAHSCGHVLICCRWDHRALSQQADVRIVWRNGEQLENSAEGDNTNEQVLFFSTDEGRVWHMANSGRSIVTLADGTSFDEPSAVTHSLLFEDEKGDTWLYYTIDQPMTCGREYPWRATGGGEIRRIRLFFDGTTWRTQGVGKVVWGFMRPLPDGAGGVTDTIRVSCLNAIIPVGGGRLLMPISGRDTIEEPNGCYWRENRSWMLVSDDGGDSWESASFVGGGNLLCLCEGTVVKTEKGHLFTLMRAGYHTGTSLYGSWSYDGGATWSPPVPTGLPNTRTGARPYLLRLLSGRFLLIQTDEHETSHRVNLTAFLTDEEGLYRGRWKWKRVLCTECKSNWKGSAYGAASQDSHGLIHIAFAGFTAEYNRLYTLSTEESWLTSCLYEPSAGMLEHSDGRPFWEIKQKDAFLSFINTRGRAQAGGFGAFTGRRFIAFAAKVAKCPEGGRFALASLRSSCGFQEEIGVYAMEGRIMLEDAAGLLCMGTAGGDVSVRMEVLGGNRYDVYMGGTRYAALGKGFCDPDTLITGGSYEAGESCLIHIKSFEYGELPDDR